MTGDCELEELIRKAQSQPGIYEIMDVYSRYTKLLVQSGIYLGEKAPDTIDSYSYNSA